MLLLQRVLPRDHRDKVLELLELLTLFYLLPEKIIF